KVQDMRFLAPDVAVMHALGGTIKRGKPKPSPGRDSIQTLVATKHAGKWHFAAFQNTRRGAAGGRPCSVELI
ncbi:MAG TPA: SgcJ/EcaC family oxidoreductase, partial [Streptosporangiaceae bacterium]